MTDRAPAPGVPGSAAAPARNAGGRSRNARPSRAAFGAIWVTLAMFLGVLALLALQLRSGGDPALRARAAATPLPPRRVLLRKVYEKRVVIHLPASAPPQAPSASQQVSAAGGEFGLPVTRTS